MKRTTPINDRKTVGYVFGGSVRKRLKKTTELKESGCYMVLCSALKNKNFIEFMKNGQSGNGIIVSLNNHGWVEHIR